MPRLRVEGTELLHGDQLSSSSDSKDFPEFALGEQKAGNKSWGWGERKEVRGKTTLGVERSSKHFCLGDLLTLRSSGTGWSEGGVRLFS